MQRQSAIKCLHQTREHTHLYGVIIYSPFIFTVSPSSLSVSQRHVCSQSPLHLQVISSSPETLFTLRKKKKKGGEKRKGKTESLLHPGTSCLNEKPPICPQQDRQREGRSCQAVEKRLSEMEGVCCSDPSVWRLLISLS